MSEEILPKSKNTYTKASSLQKTFSQMSTNQPNLTKVLNPLINSVTNKHQFPTSQNSEHVLTKYSGFHSRQFSNSTTENENYLNVKGYMEPKLKNPQYNFYRGDLNSSSDVSFMNNSFQDCREQIEQKISQKFNNSKCEIEDLIQQSPSKNRKRSDLKQIKRQKLRFYHCDQIIIRPCVSNKPVKVIDLAICPTKTRINESNINIQISNNASQNEYVQRPFVGNHYTDESKKKISEKKLLDLINESPMENSKHYNNNHQFIMDSPSFLDHAHQVDQQRNPSKSAKQINLRPFDNQLHGKNRKEFPKNEQNFETKSNTSHNSKASVHKSIANSLEKRAIKNEQNMEDSNVGLPFKRRNRIFGNDKKYGLKLSRAIRQQAQIQMLKGQLGVDVFHIIIEQDQLLRQCCT